MTLQSAEHIYQSDLMNVPPLADAMGFGLIGSWILNGLSYSYTGNAFTLQAGKAILQGRVFFLDTNRVFTIPSTAGTYYITMSMDLSKTNTQDSSGNVTNNQFTLQVKLSSAMVWGSATNGDLQTDVALYKVVSDGTKITTVTQITFSYYSSVSVPFSGSATNNTFNDKILFSRAGYLVTLSAQSNGITNAMTSGTSYTLLTGGILPVDFRPGGNQFITWFGNGNIPVRTTVQSDGSMISSSNTNLNSGLWIGLGGIFTSQLAIKSPSAL